MLQVKKWKTCILPLTAALHFHCRLPLHCSSCFLDPCDHWTNSGTYENSVRVTCEALFAQEGVTKILIHLLISFLYVFISLKVQSFQNLFVISKISLLYFVHILALQLKVEGNFFPASRLPLEILRMDNRSIELYKKALEDGNEKDYNIRLMVVGPYGVGKTTFTKRLLGQDVDITERHSTDGIDVHVRQCKISLKTSQWIVEPTGNNHIYLIGFGNILSAHCR